MRIADQNYYLDDKGKVVTEEDPNQAVQIVAKGCEITDEMAKKYPAIVKAEKPAAKSEKAASPAENKANSPKANK